MGVPLFYVQEESFPSRVINYNKRFHEPGIGNTMLLLLRRTLVRNVRKSARPKVRKKSLLNNSLSDLPTS